MATLLRDEMPDKWPYVNLFPYRVSPAVLGTSDYDSYVRMLVKTIRQPFLSYDNYSLVNGEMLDPFYTNLDIIRRLESGNQNSVLELHPRKLAFQLHGALGRNLQSAGVQHYGIRRPRHSILHLLCAARLEITGWQPSTSLATARQLGICCAGSTIKSTR